MTKNSPFAYKIADVEVDPKCELGEGDFTGAELAWLILSEKATVLTEAEEEELLSVTQSPLQLEGIQPYVTPAPAPLILMTRRM